MFYIALCVMICYIWTTSAQFMDCKSFHLMEIKMQLCEKLVSLTG